MSAQKKAGAAKTAPKNRAAEIFPSRKAAFHILLAVERGQSHSDDLLRGHAVNALPAADRNLATALVLGVLRWQIQLDRQLQSLLKHPNAKLDAEILIALRLGAFQILHMDRIPARAAIDESVELAKQAGHRFASAMVNAVLRKLAKPPHSAKEIEGKRALYRGTNTVVPIAQLNDAGASRATEKPKTEGGGGFNPRMKPTKSVPALAAEEQFLPVSPEMPSISAARLALEGSLSSEMEAHPTWLVERWIGFYGLVAAQDICIYGQSQPTLAVRLDSPEVAEDLTAAGIVLEAGALLTAAYTVVAGDVAATETFREGRVRFQDEGSQLVAELAGWNREKLDQKVKSILDACAAPGGKTLILADRNPQAHIAAFEASKPRLEQLQKRLAHLGSRVECRLADATALTEELAFDLVLADVPCSGTGTLGRNPEIRHRLRLEDLTRQAERQRAILTAALRAVRPGGRVVYSTCSLEPEENEQVVAAVLATAQNARVISLKTRIGELHSEGILTQKGTERLLGSLTPEGYLRLLPGTFHTDGFFICMIERTA